MLGSLISLVAMLFPIAAPPSAASLAAVAAVAAAPALLMHSPHDIIEAWAISPDFEHDQTLFIALPRFGMLLRSRDGGGSFESAAAGLASSFVLWMSISPDFAKDHTLWCLEAGGLYVTHDGGDRWTPLAVPPQLKAAATMVASPDYAHDATIAAGTSRDGVWISRDRGTTWTRAELPGKASAPASASLLAFSPDFGKDGTLVAVLNRSSLVRSVDGGRTFAAIAAPEGVVQTIVLAEDFSARGTLWAGMLSSGVWRSDDKGVTWHPQGTATSAMNVLHLSRALGPDGGVLFASTAVDGVQVLKDGGDWTCNMDGFREQTHQTTLHYTGTMPSPAMARDNTVFAATYEGLCVSRKGGDGWTWINVLHPRIVRNLSISPRFDDDGTLWLSTYGAGLVRTGDGGKTFRLLDSLDWMFPDSIATSPDFGHDHTLLVGTPNRLLISGDGGETVRPVIPGAKGFARFVTFAPDWAQSGMAFAHLANENITRDRFVRTADRGATWTDATVNTTEAVAFASDWAVSHRMWAACPDGLYRSDDAGLTYQHVESLDAHGLMSVAVARGSDLGPESGDVIMVCSRGSEMHCSCNGGRFWRPMPVGSPPVHPNKVRMSPAFATDGLAFAGPLNDALHVTRDGGLTWSPVTGGPRIVLAVEISPTFETDHTLVVGSYEAAWISRDAGLTWAQLDFPVPAEPVVSHEGPGSSGRTAPHH